jgi:hypothetical protein
MLTRDNLELIMDLGVNLLRNKPPDALISNHALVIRECSEKNLVKYEKAFSRWLFPLLLVKSFIMGLAKVFHDALGGCKVTKFGDSGEADIVFLSHLTNRSQLLSANDPYFGTLPNEMVSQRYSVVTAFINHCGVCPKKLKAEDVIKSRRIWLLPQGTGLLCGLRAFGQMIRVSISLLRRVGDQDGEAERDYFRLIATAQLDHHSLVALQLSNKIRQVCMDLRPSVLIVTFEGYPWERLVCKRLHEKFPKITIIGYQHSVIAKGPRAINHKFGDGMDPDHVFCAGLFLRDSLIEDGEILSENTTIIGTPKCVLSERAMGEEHPKLGACILAVPEGIMSESLILGRALAELARLVPDIPCILRLHPLISTAKLLRQCSHIQSAPENFSFSCQPLENDINDAGWLLYRGSSVVINAISNGVRPLYFGNTQRNIGDILPTYLKWRVKCSSVEDLAKQIELDRNLTSNAKKKLKLDLAEARNFTDSYHGPLNTELAIRVINQYRQK